jgi:hypothetical protein
MAATQIGPFRTASRQHPTTAELAHKADLACQRYQCQLPEDGEGDNSSSTGSRI